MVTPELLLQLADNIDNRLGPISGREADRLAIVLREAGRQIAGIRHPTGSEYFVEELKRLGAPAPWRLCDEEVGEVLADNGAIVLADIAGESPDEQEAGREVLSVQSETGDEDQDRALAQLLVDLVNGAEE